MAVSNLESLNQLELIGNFGGAVTGNNHLEALMSIKFIMKKAADCYRIRTNQHQPGTRLYGARLEHRGCLQHVISFLRLDRDGCSFV